MISKTDCAFPSVVAPDRPSGPVTPKVAAGTKATVVGTVKEWVAWGPRGFHVQTSQGATVFVPRESLNGSQLALMKQAARSGSSMQVKGTYNEAGHLEPVRGGVVPREPART